MAQDFHCPHCRADFTSHEALSAHVAEVHHHSKFRCTTCDEAFMAEMKWLDDYDPPSETA
jgi:hypothetical protein